MAALGLASAGTAAGGGTAGPAGTMITSSDGLLTVSIPPGAMTEERNFTITRYTPATSALPNRYFPTTPAYEITPSYRFEKDVTVTLTLDTTTIAALNLAQSRSQGFSHSTTSEADDAERFPDWTGQSSYVSGDRLVMATRTFSIFSGGTPPSGNRPPTISGAFYYLKPSLSFVPDRIRARVTEPDGDSMTVYVLTGSPGGQLNLVPMVAEGASGWYSAAIPYESMSAAGIVMQIVAVDQFGLNATVPSAPFNYPADSGNASYISGYDPDQDGDGFLDAWEKDNGFNPNNASDPTGIPDTDSDGLPDTADHTPSGEANPGIDSLTIFPANVAMEIGEDVSFAASASMGGQFRFVTTTFSITGVTDVGTLNASVFHATAPGTTGVMAAVGARNSTASVVIRDSLAPGNISDLAASAITHTKIRLQWTAPGDDGVSGVAAAYEIRRSGAPITNNLQCDAAATMAHALLPKPAGATETLDINGLSPSTTYYFCVRAFDSDGNRGSWTQGVVSATTQPMPDLVAPAAISASTATTLSPTSIRINWTATGDDGTAGSAASYELRRATTPITNDTQCDSAAEVVNNVTPAPYGSPLSFTVTGLSENTVYYFCIRAFDDANNRSAWTGSLGATTRNANDPPIADAGPDQTVTRNGGPFPAVNLSGTGSSDPDAAGCAANGSNYSATWTFLSRPAGSSASLAGANSLAASFTPDMPGTYLLQLAFTDDPGLCAGGAQTAVDTISISANEVFGILPLGAYCNAPGDCQTGFCVDNTCADSACTNMCYGVKWVTGLPDGVCGPFFAGTDPWGECAGASSCDGSGGCSP